VEKIVKKGRFIETGLGQPQVEKELSSQVFLLRSSGMKDQRKFWYGVLYYFAQVKTFSLLKFPSLRKQ